MSLWDRFSQSSKKSKKPPPLSEPAIIIDIEDHAAALFQEISKEHETIRKENTGEA